MMPRMKPPLKNVVLETNEAYQKALQWFFSFPTEEIGLSELAQQLKISKTTANRVVSMLESEGFLAKRVFGNLWRISCNQQHIYNYSRKIAYNLMIIYESGAVTDIIARTPGWKAIILFGSYRKGDDTEVSDIDIAVEVAGDRPLAIQHMGIIHALGYRKDVKVNAHIFSRKNVDLNLFANIANGIVLAGFLEVRQ